MSENGARAKRGAGGRAGRAAPRRPHRKNKTQKKKESLTLREDVRQVAHVLGERQVARVVHRLPAQQPRHFWRLAARRDGRRRPPLDARLGPELLAADFLRRQDRARALDSRGVVQQRGDHVLRLAHGDHQVGPQLAQRPLQVAEGLEQKFRAEGAHFRGAAVARGGELRRVQHVDGEDARGLAAADAAGGVVEHDVVVQAQVVAQPGDQAAGLAGGRGRAAAGGRGRRRGGGGGGRRRGRPCFCRHCAAAVADRCGRARRGGGTQDRGGATAGAEHEGRGREREEGRQAGGLWLSVLFVSCARAARIKCGSGRLGAYWWCGCRIRAFRVLR